jgi:F-type H+-transporting ATPase subunit g
MYNAQVVSSLARQVYKTEKLAFPTDIGSWARAYSQIYSKASNAGYWKDLLKTGAWAATGIVVSSLLL